MDWMLILQIYLWGLIPTLGVAIWAARERAEFTSDLVGILIAWLIWPITLIAVLVGRFLNYMKG